MEVLRAPVRPSPLVCVSRDSAYIVSASCTSSIGGGFAQPQGVSVDAYGNVYLADTDILA
jgi:hypothetical protein